MDPISRRSLIKGACAVLALGAGALGGGALPAAANNAVKRLSNGRLSVKVSAVPALAQIGGAARIGSLRGQPVALARTGERTYVAFNLSCPHQGVIVKRDETGWVCPAHNSQFEADGDLLLGPATSGLAKVRSRVNGGQVIIG